MDRDKMNRLATFSPGALSRPALSAGYAQAQTKAAPNGEGARPAQSRVAG